MAAESDTDAGDDCGSLFAVRARLLERHECASVGIGQSTRVYGAFAPL
jgi:hypothetical protein